MTVSPAVDLAFKRLRYQDLHGRVWTALLDGWTYDDRRGNLWRLTHEDMQTMIDKEQP